MTQIVICNILLQGKLSNFKCDTCPKPRGRRVGGHCQSKLLQTIFCDFRVVILASFRRKLADHVPSSYSVWDKEDAHSLGKVQVQHAKEDTGASIKEPQLRVVQEGIEKSPPLPPYRNGRLLVFPGPSGRWRDPLSGPQAAATAVFPNFLGNQQLV